MECALVGDRVFVENCRWLDNHAVLISEGKISAIVPEGKVPDALCRYAVSGMLVPGFIDVQVNGGGGILFNDMPTVASIAAIGSAHSYYGTTGFLPTLITDTPECMRIALASIKDAIAQKIPGLLGVHLEGPFLNKARSGIHEPSHIRLMSADDAALMINFARSLPAGFVLHITIAPELVPSDMIRQLAEAGIIISAGHTAATAEEIVQARSQGLRGFTHLFNAMVPLMGRDPGPVGAAMIDPESYCSIIVDLHHVSPVSLKAAIRAHGSERMMLVTDAMSTVGSDIDHFLLYGQKITRSNGRLTSEGGTLAGSDLDMASAVRNTVHYLDIPLQEALRMASAYPAAFLGLDKEVGCIAPGMRANIIALDEKLTVTHTWINGQVNIALEGGM